MNKNFTLLDLNGGGVGIRKPSPDKIVEDFLQDQDSVSIIMRKLSLQTFSHNRYLNLNQASIKLR